MMDGSGQEVPDGEVERKPLPPGTNRDRYAEYKADILEGEKRDPSIGQTNSGLYHDSKGTVNEYDDGWMPDRWLDEFKDSAGKTLRSYLDELEARFGLEEARRRLGLKVADPLAVAESRSYQRRRQAYSLWMTNHDGVAAGSKEYLERMDIWAIANSRVQPIVDTATQRLIAMRGYAIKKSEIKEARVELTVEDAAEKEERKKLAEVRAFLNWDATIGKRLLPEALGGEGGA